MAVARVTPFERPEESFLAASMYARRMRSHPSTGSRPGIHCDVSAHRILSDISAFVDHADPSRHRILAAGDLNLCYTTTGFTSLFSREWSVWQRFYALGLEFLLRRFPTVVQPLRLSRRFRATRGMCRHIERGGNLLRRPTASSITPSRRVASTNGFRFAPSTG